MPPLTFRDLDGIATLSADIGKDSVKLPTSITVGQLGPAIEYAHLSLCGLVPDIVNVAELAAVRADPLISSIFGPERIWLSSGGQSKGALRAELNPKDEATLPISFQMAAKRAAVQVSGLAPGIASQLIAAFEELRGNILEHSRMPETGLLTYRATANAFEFTASDRGIGVLASLRTLEAFSSLNDHGTALSLALQEGTSRFGVGIGRGFGFRQVFAGLVNLSGLLRFRSGDHALIMDGRNINLATSQIAAKPYLNGFLVTVRVER